MQIRDLIRWGHEQKGMGPAAGEAGHPLMGVQRDLNRVFEDFWGQFGRPLSGGGTNGLLSAAAPRADLAEIENVVEVSIELPGLDEKDIDLSLSEDVLTIRGEKKSEREEERKGYYLSERSYGSFYRSIPLPSGVDAEKAEARFTKSVLTVTLPKTPEAREKVRKIEVTSN